MKLFRLTLIFIFFLLLPVTVFAADGKIIVISTGNEGDAVLLGSHDKYMLVDTSTGTSSTTFMDKYFTDLYGSNYASKITLSVLISHYHNDHIAALVNSSGIWSNSELVTALKKGKIYLPNTTYLDNYTAYATSKGWTYTDYKTSYYDSVATKANNNQVPLQVVSAGSSIPAIGDINVSILGPIGGSCSGSCIDKYLNAGGHNGSWYGHYINDNSLITMFTIGNVKYLSAGDIESSVELASYIDGYSASDSLQEEKLVSSKCSELKADILKLSHHGLPTSNSKAFLNCVKPKFAFYSKDNEDYSEEVLPEINQIANDWRMHMNIFSTIDSSNGGNGSFVFNISNDKITVEKISFEGSSYTKYNTTNVKNVTVNYIDSDSELTITTLKVTYPTALGKYFYVDDYIGSVDGYIYDFTRNEFIEGSGELTDSKRVNAYYKSTAYDIDNSKKIISGINTNYTGTSLISDIGFIAANSARIYLSNDSPVANGSIIKTGYKLKYNFGGETTTYTLAVKGDIEGDGNISKTAAKKISKHIVDGNVISGDAKLSAADYNADGRIKMNDVVRLVYDIKKGWVTKDGSKYYYDNDGKMTIGWKIIDNQKYYFDSNGKMVTSWVLVGDHLYYFAPSTGVLTTSVSGYTFSSDGYLVTAAGWRELAGYKYYSSGSNVFLSGWQKISDNWYNFDEYGRARTGFQLVVYNNGQYYYNFDSSGVLTNGWQKINGNWYYFYTGGSMATGWEKIDDNWYYLAPDGIMATGWQKINYDWYYFNPGGSMVSDTCKTIDDSRFCFTSSGVCYSGSGC